jgi:hypothetical protein
MGEFAPDKRRKMHRLRVLMAGLRRDDGMNTVEYAVGTVAAAGLAGVLYKVLTSAAIQQGLTRIVNEALK